MIQNKFVLPLLLIALASLCYSQGIPQGFVLIKGDTFLLGRVFSPDKASVRVEDFEILDHTITNVEYKAFSDETGYPPPLHWIDGKIPAGKDEFPVIYINCKDVNNYLKWLSAKDNRIYRLPTTVEFEYAARGRISIQKYAWGDEKPTAMMANFDVDNNRQFDQWEKHLKPARWGKKNKFGLYNMAGNVWNMTINNDDPATMRWKYRIEDVTMLEGSIMGGSWARSAEYL